MGFEDEVEQSNGRPCRQSDGGSKRTYELTSSIVPRGTSFHRLVELACSPVRLDPVRLSCCYNFPGPAELGAVNPDAVLGILQVRKRAARIGRNPATGEAIKIKASKKVAFRAAKDLKMAV